MTDVDRGDVLALLSRHGLCDAGKVRLTPLTGGVSSDVVLADDGVRRLVVKRALPELTVGDGWYADVSRALTEARFAQVLNELAPGACPRVLAIDETSRSFVMECAPQGSRTWKDPLLDQVVDVDVARRVGGLFGKLHARSATRPDLADEFADTSHFTALRIDPYLRVIQQRHPDLASSVQTTVDLLGQPGRCLVHGDASPKNVLNAPDGSVLVIDHEVAHWGNPAFDIAFLINHLCLKAFARPAAASEYVMAAREVLSAYAAHSGTVGAADDEICTIVPALMLARVDGKSPVEYFDDNLRAAVRHLARHLLYTSPDLDTCFAAVIEQARQPSVRGHT